jgi:glycosyltransferase involved in cell wall biosynthesis
VKVAYILHTFPSLSQTFVLNEIVELQKRRHEVTICALELDDRIIHPEVTEWGLDRKVHYPQNLPPPSLLDRLKLYRDGSWRPLREWWSFTDQVARFVKVVMDVGCDLVHTHFAGKPSRLARAVASGAGLPFSLTAHAYDIFREPLRGWVADDLTAADLLITPSEYNRGYLQDRFGVESRVVHATIDPDLFPLVPLATEPNVLAMARLISKKGIDVAIQALPAVLAKVPEARLIVGGDGPDRERLERLAGELGVADQVEFTGYLEHEEYRSVLTSTQVAVLPCRISEDQDRDVCPLTLQEAMASGIPVLSCDIHSIPELVRPQCGGLVGPDDPAALAAELVGLLSSEDRRRRAGAAGRRVIEEEFNIATQVGLLLEEWGLLLEMGKRNRSKLT